MRTRPLSQDEVHQLRRYRRAGGRVHDRLLPHAAHQFRAYVLRAGQPDAADLIPEPALIALLAAFRLVYARKEPTHFGRIATVVHQVGDDDTRRVVALLREGWRSTPCRPFRFTLHGVCFD